MRSDPSLFHPEVCNNRHRGRPGFTQLGLAKPSFDNLIGDRERPDRWHHVAKRTRRLKIYDETRIFWSIAATGCRPASRPRHAMGVYPSSRYHNGLPGQTDYPPKANSTTKTIQIMVADTTTRQERQWMRFSTL
jgi:hypothetical protein